MISQEILRTVLERIDHFSSLLPFDLNRENLVIFDFTNSNQQLLKINLNNPDHFTSYVFNELDRNNAKIAIGKYNEDRTIYQWGSLFNTSKEPRTIHLGIDLWAAAGTALFAPLAGKIHSFNDNKNRGDYGPTIIMEHTILGVRFYTLYGHLSKDSLTGLSERKKIAKGQRFAAIGNNKENGQWPPHVHFQLIMEMSNKKSDFPGVASLSEREKYLALSPDPNWILRIKQLEQK